MALRRKGDMSEQMIEAILEAIPVCPIHGTKMEPASWYVDSDGRTTETYYVCAQCGKERKPGEHTVYLTSGPIIPYYRPGVLAANGERVPY